MVFRSISRFVSRVIFRFVSLFLPSQPQTSSPEEPPAQPPAQPEAHTASTVPAANPILTTSTHPSSSAPSATASHTSPADHNPRELTKLGKDCQPGKAKRGSVLHAVEDAIAYKVREIWEEAPNRLVDLERMLDYVKSLEIVVTQPDEIYVQRCINYFWQQIRDADQAIGMRSDGSPRQPPSANESYDATSMIEESHPARGLSRSSIRIFIMNKNKQFQSINARSREGDTSYISRQLVEDLGLQYLPDSTSNVTAELFLSAGNSTLQCTLHVMDDNAGMFTGVVLGYDDSRFLALGHDRNSVNLAGDDASPFPNMARTRLSTASHVSSAEDNDATVVVLKMLNVQDKALTYLGNSKQSLSARTSRRASSETGPRMGQRIT